MERTNPNRQHTPVAQDGYTIEPNADYFTTDPSARHNKRAALIMLMVGGVAFGSFLWLRMRLVSDMPRQAYAEPEAVQATPQHPEHPGEPQSLQPSLEPHADDSRPYTVNDASGGVN